MIHDGHFRTMTSTAATKLKVMVQKNASPNDDNSKKATWHAQYRHVCLKERGLMDTVITIRRYLLGLKPVVLYVAENTNSEFSSNISDNQPALTNQLIIDLTYSSRILLFSIPRPSSINILIYPHFCLPIRPCPISSFSILF